MAELRKKPEAPDPLVKDRPQDALQRRAVAVDPPPAGAIGIQELLSRLEVFLEAGELQSSPQDGAVGVRQLLSRLNHLADAGYFSPPEREDSGNE